MVRVRVQKCSDSKTGMSAYILELVESNRSAYARCWITCDVNRKQSIRGHTTEHVMVGKDYIYAKAMRTRVHKITIQAIWQLFLQQLMDSGGNVSDLVVTPNCYMIRMVPEKSSWCRNEQGGQQV